MADLAADACGVRAGSYVVLLGAWSALLLASCGGADQPQAEQPASSPRPVRVVRAQLRPMERALQVVGTLSPHEESTAAAQVAGQIEAIRVDIGDRVAAGQEVALIDTTAYEAQARQSAANLGEAAAGAANAARTLARVEALHGDGIASASDLDRAVAEAERTRAGVEAARAAEAIAELELARSRVRAAFDGSVAERIASVGDYVGVGAPILTLVKTDPLRLRLDVPERESVAVRVGQPVRIVVEGDATVHSGRIARVAPAIRELDRTLQVEADVPNRGALRAGLFARAWIVVSEADPGLSVPARALVTFAGLEKVVTVDDGRAAERGVTTGRRGGDWVEIVSGLSAGELVVLDPAGLQTGQPVLVEAADAG